MRNEPVEEIGLGKLVGIPELEPTNAVDLAPDLAMDDAIIDLAHRVNDGGVVAAAEAPDPS